MISRLRRFVRELSANTSGNALLMVAAGMPALIGGGGMAVDVSQWYMWKRELQFAVDQAALAGAYAKASGDSAVQQTYTQRATKEYNANLSIVDDFDASSGPTIALADYGSGTNNSVKVTASATKQLPFSSMLTGRSTTVTVSAQATFQGAANFTACMYALNPSAYQAFKLGNSVTGGSTCGAGTRSNDPNAAMKETGDTDVPLGSIVAAGEIEDTFANNGTMHEDIGGLVDPYSAVPEPDATGQPAGTTYPATCPVSTPASTTYTANGSTRTHTTYRYYKGSNSNNWTEQTPYGSEKVGYLAPGWDPTDWPGVAFTNKSVIAGTATGIQTETASAAGTPVHINAQNGSNALWRVPYTSTQDNITQVDEHVTPASDGKVYLSPGVYSSIIFTCDTVLAPGIYFVSGDLDFGHNREITATGGVMFYLTGNTGHITINSNSNVTLSGISASMLTSTYGYSAENAAKIDKMLFWDPDNDTDFTLNGNATMHLSGILYMPNREATFNGSGEAGSSDGSCLMVAADKIKIEGNFSLSNFCVTSGGSAMSIGGTTGVVKLVA